MKVIDITPQLPKKEKFNLAAYCRVSSDSEDQMHSFATQIRRYSAYAKEHPQYELVDVYADEGLTGTDMNKRDDFLRMLRDCRAGKIDMIITKSVARFARNTIELLETLRMLKELGVSVLFEEQGLLTEQLNSEMLVTFPGMAAQKESEAISGNLRWSYQKRMASGEFNCCTPAYGYAMVDGELAINEDEAKVVRRIFQMYLDGDGIQTITQKLNDEGIQRRIGKKWWHHNGIKYILTNERYKGDALLQKRFTTETLPFRRVVNEGQQPRYYVENSNPAIVSREVFDTVQGLLKTRKNENCRRNPHLLSSKMRCPECGGTFRRQAIGDKVYWLCMKTASGFAKCKSRRVREDMVYESFVNMTYKLKEYREELLIPLIANIEFLQSRTSVNQEEIKKIDKEIADYAAKNLVLTNLQTSGIISSVEYAEQSDEINRKMAELRNLKRKKISEDIDSEFEELQELNEFMEDFIPSTQIDTETFDQLVKKVLVNDGAKITFYLLGGLMLTEEIEEKGRSKSA